MSEFSFAYSQLVPNQDQTGYEEQSFPPEKELFSGVFASNAQFTVCCVSFREDINRDLLWEKIESMFRGQFQICFQKSITCAESYTDVKVLPPNAGVRALLNSICDALGAKNYPVTDFVDFLRNMEGAQLLDYERLTQFCNVATNDQYIALLLQIPQGLYQALKSSPSILPAQVRKILSVTGFQINGQSYILVEEEKYKSYDTRPNQRQDKEPEVARGPSEINQTEEMLSESLKEQEAKKRFVKVYKKPYSLKMEERFARNENEKER